MKTPSLDRLRLLLFFMFASAQTAFGASSTLPRYQVTDLGPLPRRSYSSWLRINNHGQVAGIADSGSSANVFLHEEGSRRDLDPMPGRNNPILWDFNDAGQILGNAGFTYSTNISDLPFFYDGSSFVDLPVFPGAWFTFVQGINNHGDMVGNVRFEDSTSRGFIFANGVFSLPDATTGENSSPIIYARDVNDSETILAWFYRTNGNTLATRTALIANGIATDIGTLPGGEATTGEIINNRGHIAGFATTKSNRVNHGFFYRDGMLTDFGRHIVNDLNNNDQMVGSLNGRPVLFTDGEWHRLGPLIRAGGVWEDFTVNGINDAGEIVGAARRKGGNRARAILLTPIVR